MKLILLIINYRVWVNEGFKLLFHAHRQACFDSSREASCRSNSGDVSPFGSRTESWKTCELSREPLIEISQYFRQLFPRRVYRGISPAGEQLRRRWPLVSLVNAMKYRVPSSSYRQVLSLVNSSTCRLSCFPPSQPVFPEWGLICPSRIDCKTRPSRLQSVTRTLLLVLFLFD